MTTIGSRDGYQGMRNIRMQEKLNSGDAIDVSGCERIDHYYVLDRFEEDGPDYCDAVLEQWMWSIGKRKADGVILASEHPDLYQNPEFECLWLR